MTGTDHGSRPGGETAERLQWHSTRRNSRLWPTFAWRGPPAARRRQGL